MNPQLLSSIKDGTKLARSSPTIVTDRHLNQFEEVLAEDGTYVKRSLGNKRSTLTAAEAAYFIDNKACKVMDGLYIGGQDAAASKETLTGGGITHILCLATNGKRVFAEEFEYFLRDIDDLPHAPLLDIIDECVAFIDTALTSGGRVLVHCTQGISRSASVVIAYVMFKQRVPYAQAFVTVAAARPSIRPNYGFEQQLAAYERRLLGLAPVSE